jgi:hypothetical protein
VQDAIGLVFHKFDELQSVRQVLVWMRREQIQLPAVVHSHGRQSIEWKAPVYRALHHILTKPAYAGAYAFGRRSTRVKIENGRKRIIRSLHRSWNDWEVLIKDHHEGYITWVEFERNQRLISDNANRKSNMGRGSIRRGETLLAGLLRCARCGRKLTVSYSGKGGPTQRYVCRGPSDQMGASNCISFGGSRIDRAVAQEVLDRLQPLGIEAALAAMNAHGYMDPGNWATSLAGGSKFGYALLFIALLSNIMAIILQHLCARMAMATGRDLAQACRDAYPRRFSYPLWAHEERI